MKNNKPHYPHQQMQGYQLIGWSYVTKWRVLGSFLPTDCKANLSYPATYPILQFILSYCTISYHRIVSYSSDRILLIGSYPTHRIVSYSSDHILIIISYPTAPLYPILSYPTGPLYPVARLWLVPRVVVTGHVWHEGKEMRKYKEKVYLVHPAPCPFHALFILFVL